MKTQISVDVVVIGANDMKDVVAGLAVVVCSSSGLTGKVQYATGVEAIGAMAR